MNAAGFKYDITLLTDARYLTPKPGDGYVENIFLEDRLLRVALEQRGLRVHRTHWDDRQFDWRQTRLAMFRTTWDYFERFAEFSKWLDATAVKTQLLNPLPLIRWNLDKHYLNDLADKGVRIPQPYLLSRATVGGWQKLPCRPAGANVSLSLRSQAPPGIPTVLRRRRPTPTKRFSAN